MHTEPYEKYSIRAPRSWGKAASVMGVHPVIIRKVYIDRWFTGMDARTFISLICDDRESCQDKKFKEILTKELSEVQMTPEEIEAKEKVYQEAYLENDFCDLINYRLKQLIEVGDEIYSNETKTFLSGGQYQTENKRYKIIELNDKRDGLTDFTAITDSDVDENPIFWCIHGVRSLWRNGKEIWNWNLAYYDLYQEQNPNDPHLDELKTHCEQQAKKLNGSK